MAPPSTPYHCAPPKATPLAPEPREASYLDCRQWSTGGSKARGSEKIPWSSRYFLTCPRKCAKYTVRRNKEQKHARHLHPWHQATLVPHTKDALAVWILKGFLHCLALFFTYACYTGNKKPASTFILSNKELGKEENSSLGGTEQEQVPC